MGGDCLNTGCVPSKALIRAARAAADMRDAAKFGVQVPEDGVRVDFGAVMERMRRLRAGISAHDSAKRFADIGVDVYLGQASFTGPKEIRVGGARLAFSRACIATGTRPAIPPIPGIEQAHPLTNETVFTLTDLPKRLAVLGAGPIGVEMAQTFARFGSEVTLIEQAPGVLAKDDRQAAAVVERSLRRDGVVMRLNSRVLRVATDGNDTVIILDAGGGRQASEVRSDRMLVAAGRAPNVENLGLEDAGVSYHEREGVLVDDRLRTSNRRVYGAGDICSAFKFTHVADAMARIVIRNALFLGRSRASALNIPWCTYSDPELAHVGLSESEAERRNIPIETFAAEMAAVDRAVLDGEAEGFVKIHCKRGRDSIVGATVVGKHAGEMISEITVAMNSGAGLRAVAETIHPYPTRAEAILKAAAAYQRSRLTPGARKLLKLMLWRHG